MAWSVVLASLLATGGTGVVSPLHAQTEQTEQEAGAGRHALGPLRSEEGSPLQQLALTPMTEGTDPVGEGTFSSDVWLGYANIFEQDSTDTHVTLVDLERLATVTTVRYGFTKALEVGGRLMFETTGGGILDEALIRWHNFLGVGNANRERFPNSQHVVRLRDAAGNTILDAPESRAFRLRDARIFGKWRVLGGPDRTGALALRGTVRFPVPTHDRIAERIDLGLSVLGRLSGSSWHGHAMGGWATIRSEWVENEALMRDHAYHAMLGVERSLGRRWAAVGQFQIVSPVLRSLAGKELDGLVGNLVLGVAGRSDSGWSWDLSFQEDIPAETPGIDFTVGVTVRRAWPD